MATRIHPVLAIWWAALLVFSPAAGAADIKILSDGPLEPALINIADAFNRQTGHRVSITYGIGSAVKMRILRGVMFDLMIATSRDIDELSEGGKLVAEGQVRIASVGVGLSVRDGVPLPDISTPAAFKQALLRADSIVYSNLASGNYFDIILEGLGIAEDVKSKITRMTSGADVFDEVLKRKGNDIAIGLMTHIHAYARNGLRLIGPLPPDVQSHIDYNAAVMTGASSPNAAKEFIRFLASPAAKAALAAIGAY